MSERMRLVLVLATAALVVVGCGRDKAAPAGGKAATPVAQSFTVTSATVEARDVQRTVETTGSLLAWEEVTLNTPVPGTIARLLADLGDRVESGQIVAELDKREFTLAVQQAQAVLRASQDGLARAQAQVASSRANLEQVKQSRKSWEAGLNRTRAVLEEAQLNLERNRRLVDAQLVAQRDFDASRTQHESALAQHQVSQVEMGQYPDRVRVAEAQLQSDLSAVQVAEAEIERRQAELGLTQKKLTDATLRSPIRGAVAKRHVNPAEFVKDNAPIFTIVRADILKYVGAVAEHAALDMQIGQSVTLQVDAAPGRSFTGRITRVSPAVDVANRTIAIEAEVANPQHVLKPGLFARGVAETGHDRGVAFVPEAAVSYFVGITKVFVVEDGKARERAVKLGVKQDGAVQVLEGVKPGEQVATSGLAQLYDGAPVTVAGRKGA